MKNSKRLTLIVNHTNLVLSSETKVSIHLFPVLCHSEPDEESQD